MKRPIVSRIEELNGYYAGHPIFVLGTGPTMWGFDSSVLDRFVTVAVNGLIKHIQPTIHTWIDAEARDEWEDYLNRTLLLAPEPAMPANGYAPAHEIKYESGFVPVRFEQGIFAGGFAGLTALHIAMLLGGDPIYLLGFDFTNPESGDLVYSKSFPFFERLTLETKPPRIFNCNEKSGLKLFPHKYIQDAFYEARGF